MMSEVSPVRKENPAMTVLRWIAFLPASIISGYLAWFLLKLVNRVSFSMTGVNPDALLSRIFIERVSQGFLGAAIVYVAAQIVPSHKTVIVFVMAGLTILGAGIAMFPSIIMKNLWAIYGCICMAVGAGGVAWLVYKGELKYDDEEHLS